MQNFFIQNRGFSLIEVLVASAILITIAVGSIGALQLYSKIAISGTEQTQAALLVQEAAEAVQLMRDANWDTNIAPLTLDIPYHLNWDGSAYSATTTPVVLDSRFTRTITLSAVERDGSDQIVESGTVDAGTLLVHVEVFRASDSSLLVDSDFLVHNIYEE